MKEQQRPNSFPGSSAQVVEWMTMWAAEMRNDFVVHQNGRTTYELITGHRFPIAVAVSGEEVMFLEVHKKTGANT